MQPVALSASLRQRVSGWQQRAKQSNGRRTNIITAHVSDDERCSSLMMRSKATEKSVSKILGKTKAKYYDAARNDVINLLRTYRGLSPNLDTFVYDNGDERLVVYIFWHFYSLILKEENSLCFNQISFKFRRDSVIEIFDVMCHLNYV